MIAFIIQARVGSTRLPNKILLPFYKEKSILELLVEKLSSFSGIPIIIAAPANSENDVLETVLKDKNTHIFRGCENDVLDRFVQAAQYYGVDKIIRICSDNPFLEKNSINLLVQEAKRTNADYISFNINGKPSIKTHFGFWTEFVTLKALLQIQAMTNESLYQEQDTNYIYTHPENFNIKWLQGPDELNGRTDIRLTIDTEKDFRTIQKIYTSLTDPANITISEIAFFLEKHPDWLLSMQNEIIKNEK